jgi:hypothetical protein
MRVLQHSWSDAKFNYEFQSYYTIKVKYSVIEGLCTNNSIALYLKLDLFIFHKIKTLDKGSKGSSHGPMLIYSFGWRE